MITWLRTKFVFEGKEFLHAQQARILTLPGTVKHQIVCFFFCGLFWGLPFNKSHFTKEKKISTKVSAKAPHLPNNGIQYLAQESSNYMSVKCKLARQDQETLSYSVHKVYYIFSYIKMCIQPTNLNPGSISSKLFKHILLSKWRASPQKLAPTASPKCKSFF